MVADLPPLDCAASDDLEQELSHQADLLVLRLSDGRERLSALEDLAATLRAQLDIDEQMLRQLDGLLGRTTEMPLDSLDSRLRGAALREISVQILSQRSPAKPVHYREWYAWLREAGHHVSGKDPLASFLAQITRCPDVERVGGARSGRYRLRAAHRAAEDRA